MTKSSIKSFLLIAAGISIAASTAIFATSQQGISIQANLVNLVQYLGELHITSDGTPDGTEVLFIDGAGEFTQTRGDTALKNTNDTYFGMEGFVGGLKQGTGGYSYMNGIVGNDESANFLAILLDGTPRDYIAVQSGGITMTATQAGSDTGYDLDISGDEGIFARGVDQSTSNNMTRQDGTKGSYIMRLLNDGTLKLKNYIFPLADGSSGQVMTTDGDGQLSWADAAQGSSSIQHDKISVSSAELLALNTSPVELIAAPGVGKVIEVLDVTTRYNFNTTPYDTYTTADIVYSNAGYEVYDSTINLSVTNSVIHHGYIADSDIAENDAIILTNVLGNPENGDGTLDIYITYRVINL